jgi:hypothetical protein
MVVDPTKVVQRAFAIVVGKLFDPDDPNRGFNAQTVEYVDRAKPASSTSNRRVSRSVQPIPRECRLLSVAADRQPRRPVAEDRGASGGSGHPVFDGSVRGFLSSSCPTT